MEALGATAAILQLIELALKTTSKVYGIYTVIRDAKETHKRLVKEMRDLVRVLEQLLDAVSDTEHPDDPKAGHARVLKEMLSEEDNLLYSCSDNVSEILSLLEGSSISWPARKGKIDRLLGGIGSTREQLGFAIQTQSMATILDIRRMLERHESYMKQHVNSESHRAIFTWLNPPNVWKNLRNALQKRQPGTGEWLLATPEYGHWKATPGCLWLSGMPGAGKTIMSSTLVTSLLNETQTSAAAVVYSYFDFSSESQQQAESLLRTCLAQLASKAPEASEILADLRNRCSKGQGQDPVLEELLDSTVSAMACFPAVFLVVDALDECSDRKELLKILQELQAVPNLHLAVLSRRERDIVKGISTWAKELPLEGVQVDEDIATYIRQRMQDSDDMQEWSEEDRTKVETRLGEMAGGMFRWVQCQLDSLEQCIDSSQVEETLASLPKDLPSTYERILLSLDPRSVTRVRDVLTALAFMRRPLTVDEIMDIVGISTADYPRAKKKGNTVYLNQLLSLCSSLVTVSSNGGRARKKQEMRLAHASVKDYLVSDHLRRGPVSAFFTSPGQGHLLMAAKGVACLLDQNDVKSFGPQTLDEVPFLLYAALNWVYHAKEANSEGERANLDNLIFALFHRDDGAYVNWHRITGRLGPAESVEGFAWDIHLKDGNTLLNGGRPASKEMLLNGHIIDRPLYHATRWNLWRVVQLLLDAGHDPNGFCKGNRSPLHSGVLHRSFESMELILKYGGNINIRDWIGDTPALFCALQAKDTVTMEWLMDHGASLTPFSRKVGGLLQCAAMVGDPDVLEVILRKKPPGTTADLWYELDHTEVASLATPLQCAAFGGHLACIELLLQYGANVNFAKGKVGGPLHAAAAGGRLEAMELLLKNGADLNLMAGDYGSVLWAAGYGGNHECVRLCFDGGLFVEDPEFVGLPADKTWPEYAPDEGRVLISGIIEASVNTFCRDIFEAASRGLTSRVKAFLDASTDRKAELEKTQHIHLRTPISWAAGEGHIDTVKYLASEGANPNRWGRELDTPLEFACLSGHLKTVKCLLAIGCDADFRHAGKYRTAFVCAEIGGNKELVEFLRALDEDPSLTFEFEGQVYEYDGNMHYRPKVTEKVPEH